MAKAKLPAIFLYHEEHPKGKKFSGEYAHANAERLSEDGWVDTPAKLDIPEPEPEEITEEQAEAMSPTGLVNKVKALGYHVLTDIELESEARKMAMTMVENSRSLAENETSTGAESESEESEKMAKLRDIFLADPEKLTKPELVELGNFYFKLGLRENMKEETLIQKIQEAAEEARKEAEAKGEE